MSAYPRRGDLPDSRTLSGHLWAGPLGPRRSAGIGAAGTQHVCPSPPLFFPSSRARTGLARSHGRRAGLGGKCDAVTAQWWTERQSVAPPSLHRVEYRERRTTRLPLIPTIRRAHGRGVPSATNAESVAGRRAPSSREVWRVDDLVRSSGNSRGVGGRPRRASGRCATPRDRGMHGSSVDPRRRGATGSGPRREEQLREAGRHDMSRPSGRGRLLVPCEARSTDPSVREGAAAPTELRVPVRPVFAVSRGTRRRGSGERVQRGVRSRSRVKIRRDCSESTATSRGGGARDECVSGKRFVPATPPKAGSSTERRAGRRIGSHAARRRSHTPLRVFHGKHGGTSSNLWRVSRRGDVEREPFRGGHRERKHALRGRARHRGGRSPGREHWNGTLCQGRTRRSRVPG